MMLLLHDQENCRKIARLLRHRIRRWPPLVIYTLFFLICISFKINCSDDVLIKGESFQISTSVLQEKTNCSADAVCNNTNWGKDWV